MLQAVQVFAAEPVQFKHVELHAEHTRPFGYFPVPQVNTHVLEFKYQEVGHVTQLTLVVEQVAQLELHFSQIGYELVSVVEKYPAEVGQGVTQVGSGMVL